MSGRKGSWGRQLTKYVHTVVNQKQLDFKSYCRRFTAIAYKAETSEALGLESLDIKHK